MPYYVPIADGEVRCDTPEEAAALLALTRREKSGSSARAVVSERICESTTGAARQQKMMKQALVFLEAIKQAGQSGIGGDKLVKKVGCDGPSGMGTLVQYVNRFIAPKLK